MVIEISELTFTKDYMKNLMKLNKRKKKMKKKNLI